MTKVFFIPYTSSRPIRNLQLTVFTVGKYSSQLTINTYGYQKDNLIFSPLKPIAYETVLPFPGCLAAIITQGYAYKAIDLSIGAIVDEETVPVTVPQRDVDVAEDGSVTVTYQFSKISLVDDSKNLDNVILSIDGFGQNSIVGECIWPLRVDRILLPQGVKAKLLLLDESYSEYDMTLANVQLPLQSDVNPAPVAVMESIVSSEGFYPDSSVKDVGISVYRGEASLKVQVNPVQYDMLAHKVRIYDRICQL